MLGLDDTIQKRPNVLSRSVDDSMVLVDMANGQCWELNRVGALLWAALDSQGSIRMSCADIVAQFDAPAEVIEADILRMANQLLSAQLVVLKR